ncbi:hypothetical protein [Actinomyces sp. ICM47]|jgi:membrane protein|uniref:hypothetical protein n=1 Tax=Actinomyces sp. ICM47 TaxID=936548 RepID=UPI0025C5CADA|nr:hypothetical protein [Actinomyces sp. ICM47]
MSVETIQSSKTWKIIFYVTATVLLLIAVGCCAWEGFRYVGISRMFVLLPLLFLLGLLLLFIIDGAKGLYYLRSAYLAFVFGVLFVVLKFMPTESLVLSIGDLSGSVSFIEPFVIFVIFMGSVALQMSLLGNLENGKGLSYVSYAFLGVIGLLFPRMMDSYTLVWGCVQKGCQEGGNEFTVLVPMYNVSFSFATTLCVLALVIYFIVPILPKMPNFSQVK